MGLALEYFYSLTPREFHNALSGFRNRQEMEFRNSWEQTRHIMFAALAPHQKKGSNLTPAKVMGLSWDNPEDDAATLKGGNVAEIQDGIDTWAKIDAKRAQNKK